VATLRATPAAPIAHADSGGYRRRIYVESRPYQKPMRSTAQIGTMLTAAMLSACIRRQRHDGVGPAAPTLNTWRSPSDSGPAAATGQINHGM